MAWSFVKASPGGNVCAHVANATSLTQANGATNLNDIMVCWTWGSSGSAQLASGVTMSDNAQGGTNTWNQKLFKNSSGNAFLWFAIFTCTVLHRTLGNSLSPKVSVTNASSTIVMCLAEFSGGTETLDGSGSTNSGTAGGAPSCGNATSTLAADLSVAGCSDTSSSNPQTVTTPTNYTDVGKETNGAQYDVGEGCYWIPAATETNNNPTWNSMGTSGDNWNAGQLFIQASAGTVIVPWPILTPRTWGYLEELYGLADYD